MSPKIMQLAVTGYGNEDLKTRLKVTEGHVEAGRILAIYQVYGPQMLLFLNSFGCFGFSWMDFGDYHGYWSGMFPILVVLAVLI